NPDPVVPNVVHDKSVLTIRNTGTSSLTISSLVLNNTTDWKIATAPATPFTIAAGASQNITVQFIANGGSALTKAYTGTLTINSSDADEPVTTVQLAGFWQAYSEHSPAPGGQYSEPTLKDVVTTFGYGTSILFSGETMNHGGLPTPVGEETI